MFTQSRSYGRLAPLAWRSALTNQEAAMQPGAPLLHDDVPQNTAFTWTLTGGDPSVFDSAEVKVQVHLVNQRLVSNFMETRGVLAQWQPMTGDLTVWSSTQIPHLVRLQLTRAIDVPEHKIRVIAPEVGGGFGAKQNFYPEEMIIPILAMRFNRPVKWIEERREHHLATTHGRDHIQDAEIVGSRDGRIAGLRVTSRANLGAYFSMFAPAVPTGLFGLLLSGVYKIPSISCQVHGVLTNTTTVDAYRGAVARKRLTWSSAWLICLPPRLAWIQSRCGEKTSSNRTNSPTPPPPASVMIAATTKLP